MWLGLAGRQYRVSHPRRRDTIGRDRLRQGQPAGRRHDASEVVDRPGHQRGGHRAAARRRRRPEGRQRPPRHGDEPGAARLPALPAGDAPRSHRPELDRPRPVHPVQRALLAHPVLPAVPVRLRPRARRPRGAAHLGLADARAPRARAHGRRRGDHRPARPGRRQRRRHGDGRAARARPARPRRRAGRVAVRPPDLRLRRRRLHGGGRLERGVLAGRSPAARQPDHVLRRQPHLDRGRHRHRVQRGRAQALLARTAGTPSASTPARTSSPSRPAIKTAQRVTDRPSIIAVRTIIGWPRRRSRTPGRTARPSARTRSARPRRSSASTPTRISPSTPRCSPTPARSSPAAARPTPSGSRASTRGRRATPTPPRCSTG